MLTYYQFLFITIYFSKRKIVNETKRFISIPPLFYSRKVQT